jgi:hypothetical protein
MREVDIGQQFSQEGNLKKKIGISEIWGCYSEI